MIENTAKERHRQAEIVKTKKAFKLLIIVN